MLTRGEVHRLVLEKLLALRGECVQEVRLVSRLYNDELLGGDATNDVFFFVPDLHLVTAAGDASFRYGFLRSDERVRVRRDVMLDHLCEAMLDVWNALPSRQVVRTVQLGDFLDLWREAELGQSGAAVATRILADHPVVQRRLVRRTGNDTLAADVLLGNHDPRAGDSPSLSFARRSIAYDVGGAFTLLATHGDRFDDLENLAPDDLQEQMVEWFGPLATAGTYQLDRTLGSQPGGVEGSQGPPPAVMQRATDADHVPDWLNLWTVRSRGAADRQAAHELLPEALVRAGYDVVVSGGPNPEDHTHWELQDDKVVERPFGRPPEHADLVWSFRPVDELPQITAFAMDIGARALWLHSGHNETGEFDREGSWLPEDDSERAFDIVEGAGLSYVEAPYIVDAVRELRG